ncbi:DUF481 domain-containing protein [Pontibacter qinzhouensis]|uniref:DUF481 domain-containing protein n=1 Tax=Pontibacter qinzhouensis TaxID=2603253 RepID=A0A5C8KAD8_9BACT|nr:DUF481 domain-containing protein [Pontibacter qinzhouensis]TXK49227.1 DUF481 domain-containing protein [Pontibacter qinzhouensis]
MRRIASTLLASLSVLLAVFCSAPAAFAQQPVVVPPSPPVPAQDTLLAPPPDSLVVPRFVLIDSVSYRFIGDGNFSWGNVDRSLVVLRTEAVFGGPAITITTNPRFAYGRQNQLLAEREWYTDMNIEVLKQNKIYGFAMGTLERSNLRRIDLRQLAGAGVGFKLLKNERHELSFTNAIIHESTNFRERPTIVTQRNSARLRGKHSFQNKRIRLSHTTFFLPSLEDFSNLRWNTIISVELPLTRWVTIRSNFENTYESIVEPGRKKNDTRVTFGFSVGNKR